MAFAMPCCVCWDPKFTRDSSFDACNISTLLRWSFSPAAAAAEGGSRVSDSF